MRLGFFRGRANICGQRVERKKRRDKGPKKRKRPRRPKGARRKFSPPSPAISPEQGVVLKKKYRLACGNRTCGHVFIAETQEATCRQCGGRLLSVEDILNLA